MKRIAMLCIHSYPLGQPGNKDVGGMNVYVMEVAQRLGELGYVVDIFTHPMCGYEDFTPYRNVHIVHLHSLPMYVHKNDIPEYADEIVDEISSFMDANNISYDLVHSNYWVSAIVGDLFSKRFNIPHVVMFHTLGLVKESFDVNGFESPLRAEYEKIIMNSADCMIVPDSNELSLMRKFYNYENRNYQIVPCGVDLNAFYPVTRRVAKQQVGFELYDRVILCVGRPEPMKGFDLAIKALAKTKSKARMLFIGGGDDYSFIDNLKNLANECKVSERVQFLDNVAHEDLQKYYCASDMLLNSSYYASFSLVVLEALACGTPVVSTNTGIAPDVIQHGFNGEITDTSATSLAKGIDNLYKKLGNRRFNKTALVHAIEEYSWDVVTDRIKRLYDSFIVET